ncbi:hypothetical protein ZWY2020_000331 [Hordeum vulgare]|nr:hypothetical protein ZWY2020_000331 [Hordeum vulgare]
MARLHEACRDWGFFWVDSHGVDAALMEEVKRFVYAHYDEHLRMGSTPPTSPKTCCCQRRNPKPSPVR